MGKARNILALTVLVSSIPQLSCGGDAATPLETSSCAEIDVFQSQDAFQAALDCVGTATGSSFSGTYSTTFQNISFSTDCSVDFVRSWDFFVNTGASDSELERVLAEGHPDSPVTIGITQTAGRINLDADGDGIETDLSGWVDASGRFGALVGQYLSARDHFVAVYDGSIRGAAITGTFTTRLVKLDDAQTPGSCTLGADFTGSKQ